MSAMNVKHGFVRTFGLVGKVVILDEVHSYDAYTGTILQELVRQLSSLKCTVIILSATLTGKKTIELLKASGAKDFTADQTLEYPLITSYAAGILNYMPIENPNPSNKVSIELIHNYERAIDEVLELAEGKSQVLWIENSVQEAQETYQKISARSRELNIECGLLHSRFLKCHRSQNEEIWVKKFGKDCNDADRYKKGRILIGTQVLEQSLDIDADFLVTRFCPTDMLFQRLGRLWRHKHRERPKNTSCKAWILFPSDLSIKDPFGVTAKIYDEYFLHRSAEVWTGFTEIVLPDDIRCLIEKTYHEKEYPDTDIGRLKSKSKTKQESLESKALFSLSVGAETLEEKEASTRYFEHETTECLIIREMDKTQKGCKVVFLDGQELELPSNIKRTDRKSWKDKVLRLHDNIIRIPEYQAVKTNIKELQNLGEYLYLGESDISELSVVKAIEDDSLVKLNNEPKSFKYCKVMGYRKYTEK